MQERKVLTSGGDRRVSRAWQILLTNPKAKVEELAQSVGLSESHLEHLIAKHARTTIRNMKNRMKIERLHEARRQLLESTLSLKEIRYRAGYTHNSNFSRDFKKLFLRSPAEYRRFEKKQVLPRRSRKSPK